MNSKIEQFLGVSKTEKVIDEFLKTLLPTNRDFKFLVDWKSVSNEINKYKFQIPLFDTLIHDKNFDSDFKKLIERYPDSVKVIPLLLAISTGEKGKLTLVNDFSRWDFSVFEIDFENFSTDRESEREKVLEFIKKTGLKEFFMSLAAKSIKDYLTGVKVGMDTNRRKNRSGRIMEKLLEPVVKKAAKDNGFEFYSQEKFGKLEGKIDVPDGLFSRRADFILVKNEKWVNIEVNFFNTSGSKPEEIVNSYIDRQRKIKSCGGEFIFITDGKGWQKNNKSKNQNQVKVAFNELDYILNLNFVKRGLLANILKAI